TLTLTASRTFGTTDALGTWEVYATYQDAAGWHDGPSAFVAVTAPAVSAPPPIWVTAYYAAWQTGVLPPAKIDFTALTHLCHFSAFPRADGTLDTTINGTLDRASAAALTQPAHAAGRKVLVTIGG